MLVLIALALALIVLLDRNHRPVPGRPLAGSSDIDDRDWARSGAELAAAGTRTRHRAVTARKAATVRLATGPR